MNIPKQPTSTASDAALAAIQAKLDDFFMCGKVALIGRDKPLGDFGFPGVAHGRVLEVVEQGGNRALLTEAWPYGDWWYVYNEQALSDILRMIPKQLAAGNWPTNPTDFVRRQVDVFAEPDLEPAVHKMIALAYADDTPQFRTKASMRVARRIEVSHEAWLRERSRLLEECLEQFPDDAPVIAAADHARDTVEALSMPLNQVMAELRQIASDVVASYRQQGFPDIGDATGALRSLSAALRGGEGLELLDAATDTFHATVKETLDNDRQAFAGTVREDLPDSFKEPLTAFYAFMRESPVAEAGRITFLEDVLKGSAIDAQFMQRGLEM